MKTNTDNSTSTMATLHFRATRFATTATFLAVFLLILTSVHAQSYRAGKSAVKAGGGTSRGGDYEVKGSIGLTDKSPTMNNSEYALKGGFLVMLAAVQSPDAPHLNISVTATNTVVISWAASGTDYVLEQNGDATTAAWSSVGPTPVADGENQRVVLPITPGNKFFRLRKP